MAVGRNDTLPTGCEIISKSLQNTSRDTGMLYKIIAACGYDEERFYKGTGPNCYSGCLPHAHEKQIDKKKCILT